MLNKIIKRCLISYANRKLQLIICHYISVGMAEIQSTEHHQMLVRTWSTGDSHNPLMRMQRVQPCGKTIQQCLRKLDIGLAFDPAIES
jgi:hypothetical protein